MNTLLPVPRRDVQLRHRLFVPESFQHKAKANLHMLLELVQTYVPPRAIILDPMAGIGSTLIAATCGHPVICMDLEPYWVNVAQANAEKVSGQWLFAASMQVAQGDARAMNLDSGAVEAVVFSPPYWDMFSDWHISSKRLGGNHRAPSGPAYADERGRASEDKHNIGNIHIYELYLREMMAVYNECWRVLGPGGTLILILKDRVHKSLVKPITGDTLMLCRLAGFELVERRDYAVRISRFQQVYRLQNPDGPRVDHETALVLRKAKKGVATKLTIVGGPANASRPAQQLFTSALDYSLSTDADSVFVLTKEGFCRAGDNGSQGPGPVIAFGPQGKRRKARLRRRWSHAQVRDLVAKLPFGSGTEITLHITRSYGQYLETRLASIGAKVTDPTAGLNLGQKLRWYAERLQS
jgi:hypothetical protein